MEAIASTVMRIDVTCVISTTLTVLVVDGSARSSSPSLRLPMGRMVVVGD